jgi:cytoskeletal protein CcmA (bactofilin family)
MRGTGQADPASAEDRNYLGEGSRVSGKLNFQGTARIDGEFEGEIAATDSVTLCENAVVTAKIKAATIIVAGTFDGEMIASDSIEIRASAKIWGNFTQGQQGQ